MIIACQIECYFISEKGYKNRLGSERSAGFVERPFLEDTISVAAQAAKSGHHDESGVQSHASSVGRKPTYESRFISLVVYLPFRCTKLLFGLYHVIIGLAVSQSNISASASGHCGNMAKTGNASNTSQSTKQHAQKQCKTNYRRQKKNMNEAIYVHLSIVTAKIANTSCWLQERPATRKASCRDTNWG